MSRYHRWWHGMEWPLGAAAVFLVVGVVMLVIVLTSASGVQWAGIRVAGTSGGGGGQGPAIRVDATSQAGVVSYAYHGADYTLTDGAHKTYVTPHHVSV